MVRKVVLEHPCGGRWSASVRGVAAIAIAAIAIACGEDGARREWTPAQHTQPERSVAAPNQTSAQPPEPDSDAAMRAALALWTMSCAPCHGREGRGDGASAPGPVPDLTTSSYQSSTSDEAMLAAIAGGKNAMPAFGERISEAGLLALVAHVRRLGQGPTPHPP